MILSSKNIELRLLDESMLETLRLWRNSNTVNQFMEYQQIISKEAQQNWFQNLSKLSNYYFIIYTENVPIGMIHLGGIIEESRTAESGMFIADENYRGTGLAFRASLLLLDFAFDHLKLSELFAKVNNDNKVAQDYNRMLGFQENGRLNDSFSKWSLKKSDFALKRVILEKLTA